MARTVPERCQPPRRAVAVEPSDKHDLIREIPLCQICSGNMVTQGDQVGIIANPPVTYPVRPVRTDVPRRQLLLPPTPDSYCLVIHVPVAELVSLHLVSLWGSPMELPSIAKRREGAFASRVFQLLSPRGECWA